MSAEYRSRLPVFLGPQWGISQMLTSIYMLVLCSLLLEATSSVLMPNSRLKHRYSNSGALPRLTFPQASASPMPSPAESSTTQISYGMINCMLAIHSDVTRCNATYHNSLTYIIVRGFRKESKKYQRQFCCGFWARERCVTDAVQRKCDKNTFELMQKEKSPYANEVDTRHGSGISCLGYEQNSAICSGTVSSRQMGSCWLHSPLLLVVSLLIYYWFALT